MKKARKFSNKNKPAPARLPKDEPGPTAADPTDKQNRWVWLLLGGFILILFLLRWRLLGIPLERDEGEYAYMGQLMQRGIPPYTLAYNMKYPGTSFMYALLMGIFGQTTEGIHLGLAVVNIGSVLLLFFIAREFMSRPAALASAITFGLLSIGSTVIGFALHATHFVALFALAGILVLMRALRNDKWWVYLAAGLLFGMAFIMKQSGVFFLAFGGLVVVIHSWFFRHYPLKKTAQSVVAFSAGGTIPFAAMIAVLYAGGAFDNFWFWTVTYLKEYGTQTTVTRAWNNFQESFKIFKSNYLLWILGTVGLLLSFFRPGNKEHKIILWSLAVFAALTIVPGFYFRTHYYITLLPVIALFCGLLVDYLAGLPAFSPSAGRTTGLVLLGIGMVTGINYDKNYLFNRAPDQISRDIYGFNPFLEAPLIAEYIRNNSSEEDRIAVLGSEPEIYFYSHRLSSTGYIYTYNMMEKHPYNQKMQQEMIREITDNPPKFIVYTNIPTSWSRKEDSPTDIFDWSKDYLREHYTITGIADLISRRQTVYKWDAEAIPYQPQSKYLIRVYRRL